MLNEKKIPHRYREYTKEPLSAEEIQRVLQLLGARPKEVLRKNDRTYKELGLNGQEEDSTLIDHMAQHPTLLQRPIGLYGQRAIVGRPPDRLLEILPSPG